jgi:protease I
MKSVILVAEGVQDEEFIYPYYRLQEEGEVVVVGSLRFGRDNYTSLKCKYGIPIKINEISTYIHRYLDADLVVVPGGWQCPEILRMDQCILKYLNDMVGQAKIIGAICHGPQVLISADVLYECEATGYVGIKDDINNYGAVYVDSPVVRHNNIITAQHYKDNPQFIKACIDAVRERKG